MKVLTEAAKKVIYLNTLFNDSTLLDEENLPLPLFFHFPLFAALE